MSDTVAPTSARMPPLSSGIPLPPAAGHARNGTYSRLWSVPVFRALFSQLGLDDTATFDDASATLHIRDGVIRTDELELHSPLLRLVGAGTVLSTEQADRAIDAGASFVVAPGTNPKVVEHCLRHNVPIIPGVATPTDIELAMSLGVTTLKFFPAENLGGTAMLKALAGPYPNVRFVPTGGITPEKLPLRLDANCPARPWMA